MDKYGKKIVAIVQARMGSTRLPGKILMDIEGKPMFVHVAQRVGQSKFIDEVVVSTTDLVADDAVENVCLERGITFFRGDETDVLDRYYKCASRNKADIVVRITADCPLIDPEVIDRVISGYMAEAPNVQGGSNVIERTYPRGLDAEVVTFKVLECLQAEVTDKSCREHVTLYMYKHPEEFKMVSVKGDKNLSDLRWTVDEADDLKFVREIYKRLYGKENIFLMNDILRLLDEEPELKEMNSTIEQKGTC